MSLQVCHFHGDEGVRGIPLGDDGTLTFTCSRVKGHPLQGSYTWLQAPPPPDHQLAGSGLAAELGLATELPAVLVPFAGQWVEYGVVEHAYAKANPQDFARLVERYGHTAVSAKRYTASAYLARVMGDLSRTGQILFHPGQATGRSAYDTDISWWALAPEPDWSMRLSWADTGHSLDYVPGSTVQDVRKLRDPRHVRRVSSLPPKEAGGTDLLLGAVLAGSRIPRIPVRPHDPCSQGAGLGPVDIHLKFVTRSLEREAEGPVIRVPLFLTTARARRSTASYCNATAHVAELSASSCVEHAGTSRWSRSNSIFTVGSFRPHPGQGFHGGALSADSTPRLLISSS